MSLFFALLLTAYADPIQYRKVYSGSGETTVNVVGVYDLGNGKAELEIEACGFLLFFRGKMSDMKSEAFQRFVFERVKETCPEA